MYNSIHYTRKHIEEHRIGNLKLTEAENKAAFVSSLAFNRTEQNLKC